jgi:hypothetical protein
MNRIVIYLSTQDTPAKKDEPDYMIEFSQKVLQNSLEELDLKYKDTLWLFVPFMFPGNGPDPEMTVCLEIRDDYFNDFIETEIISVFKEQWKDALKEIHINPGMIRDKRPE